MPHQNMEMPDGNTRTYSAQSIKDLKRRVAETLGVDEEEVAILNDSGRPVSETETPPTSGRVIPKPVWGGYINEYLLGQDLIGITSARGYNSLFYVRLIRSGQLNPFRAYLYFRSEWWPIHVELISYPIYSNPTVTFEQRIPPCPVHSWSWHPNVYDNRKVCWGNVNLLPGTKCPVPLLVVVFIISGTGHAPLLMRFASFSRIWKPTLNMAHFLSPGPTSPLSSNEYFPGAIRH